MDPLSEDEIITLLKNSNCSDRQVLQILNDLKKKWGRKIVTPNIRKLLTERKTILDQFFDVEIVMFFDKDGVQKEANVTFCNDVVQFIEFVCLHRGVEIEIGLDEGKGRFTIMYSCISRDPDPEDFKGTGVKKSFVLACSEQVSETYDNVKILFELIKMEKVRNVKFVCDLKMQNILLGLTSHASKFPRPYGLCTKEKDGKWKKGEVRCFGDISKQSELWRKETGGDRRKLKGSATLFLSYSKIA